MKSTARNDSPSPTLRLGASGRPRPNESHTRPTLARGGGGGVRRPPPRRRRRRSPLPVRRQHYQPLEAFRNEAVAAQEGTARRRKETTTARTTSFRLTSTLYASFSLGWIERGIQDSEPLTVQSDLEQIKHDYISVVILLVS